MLSRDAILNVSKSLPSEEVPVPEWGGTVFVRTMTAGERDRFEVAVNDTKRVNFRARLAALCLCDEQGKRVFSDADIPALGELPAPGLVRVCDVALKLNKFSDDDVSDLEKNSGTAPGDAP